MLKLFTGVRGTEGWAEPWSGSPPVALGADTGEPGSLNHLFLPPLLYDKHHLKVQISITPVGYREKRERPEAVETLAHPQLYKGHNACPPGQGWGEKEGLKLLFSVKFAEPKKTSWE